MSIVRSTTVEICPNCKGGGIARYPHEEEGSHGSRRTGHHDESCRSCKGSGRVKVIVSEEPFEPPAPPKVQDWS